MCWYLGGGGHPEGIGVSQDFKCMPGSVPLAQAQVKYWWPPPHIRDSLPQPCKAATLPVSLPPGGCIDQALSFLCCCIQHAIAFCLKESGNKPPVVMYPSACSPARPPAPLSHPLGLLFLNFWLFLLQWVCPFSPLPMLPPTCLGFSRGELSLAPSYFFQLFLSTARPIHSFLVWLQIFMAVGLGTEDCNDLASL